MEQKLDKDVGRVRGLSIDLDRMAMAPPANSNIPKSKLMDDDAFTIPQKPQQIATALQATFQLVAGSKGFLTKHELSAFLEAVYRGCGVPKSRAGLQAADDAKDSFQPPFTQKPISFGEAAALAMCAQALQSQLQTIIHARVLVDTGYWDLVRPYEGMIDEMQEAMVDAQRMALRLPVGSTRNAMLGHCIQFEADLDSVTAAPPVPRTTRQIPFRSPAEETGGKPVARGKEDSSEVKAKSGPEMEIYPTELAPFILPTMGGC